MKLELPQSVRAEMSRRMTRRFGPWLRHGDAPSAIADPEAEPDSAEGPWPMRYLLGSFTERDVLSKMQAVTDWAQAWRQTESSLPAGVRLEWESRQWSRLGAQAFPARLVVDSVQALANWVGQGTVWSRAQARRDELLARFPSLQGAAAISRNLGVFQDWEAADVKRLLVLLEWFEANPRSGLYLRQLPVPGIDTKWVEARRGVVKDFVQALLQRDDSQESSDFHEVCGLTKPPAKLRIRILCPELRAQLHGLCDIEAPVEELARLPLSIQTAVVVENLESGLALPDMAGAVAFMRLGHAISELARLPWLHPRGEAQQAPAVLYWGDLDTHGLVILARARGLFPQLRAVLMDEKTLLAHRHLWVSEPSPSKAQQLHGLLSEEQQLYDNLRANKWEEKVRLEQERLPWGLCLAEMEKALEGRARWLT